MSVNFIYLNHVNNQAMTYDNNFKKQTVKLLVIGNTLLRRYSFSSKELKLDWFRNHCYTLCCNSLWLRYKVALMNRLRFCHYDFLKRLFGLPWWTCTFRAFTEYWVKCLDVLLLQSVYNMKGRLKHLKISLSLPFDRAPPMCVELFNGNGWVCCLYRCAQVRTYTALTVIVYNFSSYWN